MSEDLQARLEQALLVLPPHRAAVFWSRVAKSESCWNWTGPATKAGYGHFRHDGQNRRAHRISWQMEHGAIPPGMFVCHKCDNPSCVRPDHLFLGTPADNVRDMERKGRRRNRSPRGSANGHAKLTAAMVREIRQRYASGGFSHRTLAAEYGLGTTTIGSITRRERWSHIRP